MCDSAQPPGGNAQCRQSDRTGTPPRGTAHDARTVPSLQARTHPPRHALMHAGTHPAIDSIKQARRQARTIHAGTQPCTRAPSTQARSAAAIRRRAAARPAGSRAAPAPALMHAFSSRHRNARVQQQTKRPAQQCDAERAFVVATGSSLRRAASSVPSRPLAVARQRSWACRCDAG